MFSNFQNIFNKDHLKIIITDSGLGGLSVHALLNKLLTKKRFTNRVDLIFYNSLVDHNRGYNSMSTIEEKIEVFDSALYGMLNFNPDLILIACNTLSVLFPYTKFAEKDNIPTIGIIDIGVEQILKSTNNKKDSNVIIFGTPTTIKSGEHKNKLIQRGIDSNKVFQQECLNLESEIQLNPNSEIVESMIEQYCSEITSNLEKTDQVVTSLACTHYGFCKDIFSEQLNKFFEKNVDVLNPNDAMADLVASNFKNNTSGSSTISNKVLSKVDITIQEITSLGKLLDADSPSVAKALKNYEYDANLF